MLETSADLMCPHCGEIVSVHIDLSIESQSYIEDCSVCCRPMTISYTATDGELADIQAEAAD